jgi:hypothetical protein
MLGKENVKELRQTLAHLSLPAVRGFYEQSYRGRFIYSRIPSQRRMQTLVAGLETVMEMALTSSRGKRVFLAEAAAH